MEATGLQQFVEIFNVDIQDSFGKTGPWTQLCLTFVKQIIVKFWTGRRADANVEQYLSQVCEILHQFGIWYGVRRYKVKVKRASNSSLMSILMTITMGPHNGKIIYSGQVPSCFMRFH